MTAQRSSEVDTTLFHSRLLQLIPDPVIVREPRGTILYRNEGAEATYGYTQAEAMGRSTHELLQTRFLGSALAELNQSLQRKGIWRGRLGHRHRDGSWLVVESKHVLDSDHAGNVVILEINSDTTEQDQARRALARSRATYRSQFMHSSVGQVIRDVRGTITAANPAVATMLLTSAEELVGSNVADVVDPQRNGVSINALKILANTGDEALRFDGTVRRSDGTRLDVEMTISLLRDASDIVIGVSNSFLDITDRRMREQQLTQLALHDPLTGLANRALLDDRMDLAFASARRQDALTGVIYLDLDGFKPVNDQYGHDFGDELLAEIAERMRKCVRTVDTVARVGGDEFVVLCPNLDTASRLREIAQRLHTDISRPYLLKDAASVNTITASLGIYVASGDLPASEALIRADRAMFTAKRAGRGLTIEFTEIGGGGEADAATPPPPMETQPTTFRFDRGFSIGHVAAAASSDA